MGAASHPSPLAKAIRRALTHPSHGLTSVRRHVGRQIDRWRSEGLAESAILSALLSIAADVARETGSDRIDLLTGEPRWRFVADAIRAIVPDGGPQAPAAGVAPEHDPPGRDDAGEKAGAGVAERYAAVPFPVR